MQSISHSMANLACRVFTTLGNMAANDRTKLDDLKRIYKQMSQEISDLHKRIGNTAPIIAATSLAAGSLQAFVGASYVPVIQLLANQIPQIGGVYPSHLQARESLKASNQQVQLSEITTLSQKQGPEDLKQAVQELVRSAAALAKDASRG